VEGPGAQSAKVSQNGTGGGEAQAAVEERGPQAQGPKWSLGDLFGGAVEPEGLRVLASPPGEVWRGLRGRAAGKESRGPRGPRGIWPALQELLSDVCPHLGTLRI